MNKTERPLSLPPSPSPCDIMTPTSPIETSCCRCRRAKSVNSIFLPDDEPKKKSPRLPKLAWSVFKAKDKSLLKANYVDKEHIISQNLTRETKSTSWQFVPRDKVKQSKQAQLTSRAPFVITPIASPRQPKVPNDQPKMASVNGQESRPQITLRKFVLQKDGIIQPKPGIRKKAYVPRSPGPLDGSLYAQVKKNKRIGTDDSDDSASLVNRDYEEIVKSQTNEANPTTCLSTENQEKHLTLPLTSQSHHGVDLLRDVTKVATFQSGDKLTSHGTVTSSEHSEGPAVTTLQSCCVVSTEATNVVTSVTSEMETKVEIQVDIGEDPLSVPENFRIEETESPNKAEIETPDNMSCNLLTTVANNPTKNDMDSAMALVNEFLLEEKRRTPKTQTPNVATPDSLSPDNRMYPEIQDLDGYIERNLQDDSPGFDPPLPDYPAPQSNFEEKGPEYALPDRDVIFSTVPAKSAVLITAPPVKLYNDSFIVKQVNANITSTSEETNTIFLDNALESGGYSTIAEITAVENMLNGNHKDSLDSGHSMDIPVLAPVQKATSNSDIDSGIDGSAMAISSACDIRPSPKLMRSLPLNNITQTHVEDLTILSASVQAVDLNENNNGNFSGSPHKTGSAHGIIQKPKEAEKQIIKNVYNDSGSNPDRSGTGTSGNVRHSIEIPVDETSELLEEDQNDAEEEEERRIQEDIENTRKRLLWLQEHQNKIKLKKEQKIKRNSYGYSTSTLPTKLKSSQSAHLESCTLPRAPHNRSEHKDHVLPGTMTVKEKHDIDELLRSVQELDLAINRTTSDVAKFPDLREGEKMVSTVAARDAVSLQVRQQPSYITQHHSTTTPPVTPTSPSFTPTYAHPKHQPEHMERHKLDDPASLQRKQQLARQQAQQDLLRQQQEKIRQRQLEEKQELEKLQLKRKQEELAKRQREDLHRMEIALQAQERKIRDQSIQDVKLQEERRQREREQQEKFQLEFEMKQKQLQNETSDTFLPKTYETSFAHDIRKGASSLKRESKKPVQSPPPTKSAVTPQNDDVKNESELQNQLDELDLYIAQLTQNFEDSTGNQAIATKPDAVVRRRRSFSVETERMLDPSLSTQESASPAALSTTPPRPPSRTRSSYDSVSRRLSHGFELAQLLRQNSTDLDSKDTLQSNDDVFSQDQSMPQPSYPPRTSQTRPPQQQIIGRTLSSTSYPTPKKPIEERLSPQLFLAMSVNPGARPIEDIHSYKEDLLPESPRDKNSPTTPAFPITPKTPYTNLTSPSSHVPIGITKTPLSELGLKPKPQIESETISTVGVQQLNSATKPHQVTNRTSPGFATQSHLTSSHVKQAGYGHSNSHQNVGLDERTLPSNHQPTIGSRDPTTQEYIHGTFTTSPHQPPHMGGYSDNNVRSNGWHQQHSPVPVAGGNKDLRSPWVFNEDTSPIASSPAGKSPVISSIASSSSSSSSSPPRVHGSGEVSPAGTRSLNGSHDSLLSGGSGPAHQTHHAYQKDRYSHTIQKDSRNSASSIQSTSTGGSGYLGGASQTSPHSAGSPNSGSGQYPFSHQIVNKRESQMSSYDRHGGHHFHSSDDGGLSSPASGRTSASSQSDIDKLAHEVSQANLSAPPKFVKETTAYWYKPDITREQALALLRTKPAGSFVVRASRCYPGAYGLALKVSQVPAGVLATAKPGTDMNNELVRHFLIEPSTRGVKLKGCPNEPVFGSLSALIYQHSITPLALPCKLVIPTQNQEIPPVGSSRNSTEIQNSAVELLKLGAACNVLYLGSEDTESLTGPEAIERAMRECMHNEGQAVKTSVVHFKVSPQGITLTDNARKIFFRRHYPTSTVTYCGMDPSAREPHNRRWDASKDRGPPNSRVFGFVAKKPGSSVENVCHLFAELDLDQPAPAIVNFVSKVLIGTAGAN